MNVSGQYPILPRLLSPEGCASAELDLNRNEVHLRNLLHAYGVKIAVSIPYQKKSHGKLI